MHTSADHIALFLYSGLFLLITCEKTGKSLRGRARFLIEPWRKIFYVPSAAINYLLSYNFPSQQVVQGSLAFDYQAVRFCYHSQ